MQASNENQLICPGPSMWNLITEHVDCSEVPKIRAALGHSLVDMYIELHSEAEMFHKMWQESQRRAGSMTPCQQGSPLPDPPAVKELVRAEVKILLQTLRERASRRGRDGEELLLRYNPETVNYAFGHLDCGLPFCMNQKRSDNGSKTEEITRPNSHCSVQSCIEDDIEAVSDKLNVTDIDQVAERLKFVMLEQCDMLKGLVQRLKENIKQTYRRRSEGPKPEPTVVELRKLREALQMDLNLYPPSHAAPNTDKFHLPVKELKNKFRLPGGHMASDDTLQDLNAALNYRPHLTPPLGHANPRPPARPPHTKISGSVRPFQTSSISVTHGQHKRISFIRESSKTPVCSTITSTQ